MKKLSLSKMESLTGGTAADVVDGFCAGLGRTGVIASALKLASYVPPVVKAAYWTAVAGCAGWAIYRFS
ncbi:hypothetical protein [Sphingobacterium sp. MYb382]|uniref:hypothetical protein n=1 Tax=Sphingobacterium sp. MYb382 TaxID=2745278 RepID=UPI0030AC1F8E